MNAQATVSPNLTRWSEDKLAMISFSINDFTRTVLMLCSPMSRRYHADAYLTLVRKMRIAADQIEQHAHQLERSTYGS